VIQFLKKMIKK